MSYGYCGALGRTFHTGERAFPRPAGTCCTLATSRLGCSERPGLWFARLCLVCANSARNGSRKLLTSQRASRKSCITKIPFSIVFKHFLVKSGSQGWPSVQIGGNSDGASHRTWAHSVARAAHHLLALRLASAARHTDPQHPRRWVGACGHVRLPMAPHPFHTIAPRTVIPFDVVTA